MKYIKCHVCFQKLHAIDSKSLQVLGLSLEIFYQDSEVNCFAVGVMTIKKPDFTRYQKAIISI